MPARRHAVFRYMPAAIGFLILISISIVSGYIFLVATKANDTLEQLLVARARASNVTKAIIDAETGQRGFILTGNEDFLEPYRMALAELPDFVKLLEKSMVTPADRAWFDAIRMLQTDYLADLKRSIELYRGGNKASASQIVSDGSGRRKMDALRALVTDWRKTNAEEIVELRQRVGSAEFWALVLVVAGAVAVAALGAFLIIDTRRYIRVILDLVQKLRGSATTLAEAVEKRGQELQAKTRQLRGRPLGRGAAIPRRVFGRETRSPAWVPQGVASEAGGSGFRRPPRPRARSITSCSTTN